MKLLDGLLIAGPSETFLGSDITFDERFDFHFYDLDLCRQLELEGRRMGTCGISVMHESPGNFRSAEVERRVRRLSSEMAVVTLGTEVDAYAQRGRALYLQGRCGEAVLDFDRAVELGADSVELHTLRGLALAGAQHRDAALQSYGRALALRPDYPLALVNRAILYRESRRLEDALMDYDRALTVQPDSFEAHCGRATVLLDLSRFAEALADGERAAALRPERAEGYVRMRWRWTVSIGTREALAWYDRALAIAPGMAEAHAGRAAVLQYLARHTEALAAADRAIELAPHLAAAHFNRGAALRDLARIEDAIQSFERLGRSNQTMPPRTAIWAVFCCCSADSSRAGSSTNGAAGCPRPRSSTAMPSRHGTARRTFATRRYSYTSIRAWATPFNSHASRSSRKGVARVW